MKTLFRPTQKSKVHLVQSMFFHKEYQNNVSVTAITTKYKRQLKLMSLAMSESMQKYYCMITSFMNAIYSMAENFPVLFIGELRKLLHQARFIQPRV